MSDDYCFPRYYFLYIFLLDKLKHGFGPFDYSNFVLLAFKCVGARIPGPFLVTMGHSHLSVLTNPK